MWGNFADVSTIKCRGCCHETRNAMLAVVVYAKQVKKENPTMATAMLDAAIERLDKAIKACSK